MRRLRGFWSLQTGDKVRILTAIGLLLVTWGGVSVVSFDRFRRNLLRVGDVCRYMLPGNPSVRRVVYIVELADENLPGDRTCLVRSLSTEVILRAYDLPFVHRIGVDKSQEGEFQAHSWIEYDGEILLGDLEDIEKYEPLPPLHRNETT